MGVKRVLVLAAVILAVGGCGSATTPGSGTSSHPATGDISLSGCGIDPTLGLPQVTVTVLNHSSGKSDYTYQVNFLKGNTVVASGAGLQSGIAPGQSAVDKVEGDASGVTGPVTCTLSNVTRLAST